MQNSCLMMKGSEEMMRDRDNKGKLKISVSMSRKMKMITDMV